MSPPSSSEEIKIMGSEAEAATKAAGFAKDDGAGAEAEDEDGDENSEEAAAKGTADNDAKDTAE